MNHGFACGRKEVRGVIHLVFETLAYTVGFALYRSKRQRAGDFLEDERRIWIVAAAIAGAAIGSKALGWLDDPFSLAGFWMRGKTIVGGLLGGTLAVELVKRRLGIVRRTGDLFVLPLCIGIAIGRIGCFFGGLADQTYGLPTTLPWGVDFGDGIPRHPTQLYEALFLIVLAALLRRPMREGNLFNAFLVSYLAFRLAVDAIKPGVALAGLTAIQWAAIAGIIWRGQIFWQIESDPTCSTTPPFPSARAATGGPTERSSSRTGEFT